MLPADRPLASSSRTSLSEVQEPGENPKNSAASVVTRWSWVRNRTGQVIVGASPSITLHTPRGLVASLLVQLSTRLRNGQSLLSLMCSASGERLSAGYPKISPSGLCGVLRATTSPPAPEFSFRTSYATRSAYSSLDPNLAPMAGPL